MTLLFTEIVLRVLGIGAVGRGSSWFAGSGVAFLAVMIDDRGTDFRHDRHLLQARLRRTLSSPSGRRRCSPCSGDGTSALEVTATGGDTGGSRALRQ